jgi:putative FmdB family regulatory protein
MPTYGYRCPECAHEYEAFQKMTDATRTKCPKCHTPGERQITGGAGIHFKGSGFYITDYGRTGAEKPAPDGGKAKSDGGKPSGGDAKKPAASDGAKSSKKKGDNS